MDFVAFGRQQDLAGLDFATGRAVDGPAVDLQRHDVSLGDDLSLGVAGDLRFPSRRGAQAAAGAALTHRDNAGLSVGYRRSVDRWQAERLGLGQEAATSDDRLWVAQGPTFGGWVRIDGWTVGLAASPLFLPRVDGPDRRVVETDRWLWTLGVGRGRW